MTVATESETISRPAGIPCHSIDVGLIVYNERAMIGPTLAALLAAGFDRFIVLDMQSTDGTVDYVREILGDKVQIISFPRRSLIEYGYAEARNTCASFSTRDWLLFVDADEVLVGGVEDGSVIVTNVGQRPDIYSVTHKHLERDPASGPDAISVYSTEKHNRLYRPSFRMRYSGYIHEDIFYSGERCQNTCGHTALVFDHYSKLKEMTDLHRKEGLYSLMLLRIYNQPDLRTGVSDWWYNTYVPERLAYTTTVATAFALEKGIDPSFYGPLPPGDTSSRRLKKAINAVVSRRAAPARKIKQALSKILSSS